MLHLAEVDLRDRLTSEEMEVVPLAGDGTIVGVGCARSGLVDSLCRDRAIESAVRVASIGLRLRVYADAIPTSKEVVHDRVLIVRKTRSHWSMGSMGCQVG